MGEIRQTNFRIDQETAEQFRRFCEENGLSQSQGFDHIMQVVELDKAKVATPGRITEIESFEKSVKDIMAAYITSIEINNNAEARIKEQFISTLESKDKTICSLQFKVDELEENLQTAEKTISEITQSSAQALLDAEMAKEQADTASKLAAEKERTISTLADKLSAAEEKATGYDELKKAKDKDQLTIASLQKDIENQILDFSTKSDAIKAEHDKEVELLKKDHENKIRELNMEMEKKVSDAQKDSALALSQAIAQKEREMMEQLRQADRENAKLSVVIEQLQKEIETIKNNRTK